MIEQFANNYNSLLDADINDSVTSLDVVSATGAPSSGQFRLRIDSELMLVTAVSGVTFTVTRGIEGTTAAAHVAGASVRMVVTKGALEQKRIDDVGAGVIASAPTAGATGRLYFPSDSGIIMRDNGSQFLKYGPIYPLSPVPTSGWSWVNQGTATITQTGMGELLVADSGNLSLLSCRVRTAALSPPYTITAGFILHATFGYSWGGLILRKSASGELIAFILGYDNNSHRLEMLRYTDATTFSGVGLAQERTTIASPFWLRVYYDGTDLTYYVSKDKHYWQEFYSESKIYSFSSGGPDQLGIAVHLSGGYPAVALHLIDWEEV